MTDKHSYQQSFETGIPPEDRPGRDLAKKNGGLLEFLIILIVAFALVFGFVRPFVVEAFSIPSESMVPTLAVGDRVFVNKFIYRFHQPERGDIVVFRSVEGEDEDLIKRIVAVAGDQVEVRDGELLINSAPQKEPYVNSRHPDRSYFNPTTVPAGDVFAMGDNRANSRDSRYFGPVPVEDIEGEAFVVFWPPAHVKLL